MTNPLLCISLPHIFPYVNMSTVCGSQTPGNTISHSNSETFRISSTGVLMHQSM